MKPFWFVFVLASFAFCLKGENIIDKHQSSLLLYLIDGLGWADFIHGPMISGVFWYMCLAQLILLFIPLTYKLLNTLSNYGFISLCFITIIVMQVMPDSIKSVYGGGYINYLPAYLLGCKFSQDDILRKLSSAKITRLKRIIISFILMLLTGVMLIIRYKLIGNDFFRLGGGMLNSFAALSIVLLFGVYLNISALSKILMFLGKYSGIMYLTHTLIAVLVPQIVYISRFAIINYFANVIESLAVSILCAYLMKWTRYYMMLDRVYDYISQKTHNLGLISKNSTAANS